MKVGFAKVGQRLQLRSGGFQGSGSPARLLRRLAGRNPSVEWVIVSRADDWKRDEWPENVSYAWPLDMSRAQPYHNAYDNGIRSLKVVHQELLDYENEVIIPLIETLDGMIVMLGTNMSGSIEIPKDKTTWAQRNLMKPVEVMLNTARPVVEGLNRLGDRTAGAAPVIFLVEDPRNILKARDIKWPTGTGVTIASESKDALKVINV